MLHFEPQTETYFMQDVNFKISSTCLKGKKYNLLEMLIWDSHNGNS